MPIPHSLKGRLGWGLSVSLVTLFAVQSVVVGIMIRSLAESRIASRLSHDAESILVAIEFSAARPDRNVRNTQPDQNVRLNPTRIDPIYNRPYSGHYYLVEAAGERLRSRSLWDHALAADLNQRNPDGIYLSGPQNQPLLVVVHHFTRGDQAIRVAVAEDLTALLVAVRRAQWQYGLMSLGALILLLAVQRSIVSATLRPLDGVRADIAALERGELAALRETVPNEVRPLVAEFNRLLALMGGRVERSRNALGNLAHALKTPLTLLTQLGEQSELSAHPQLVQRLDRETGKIGILVERELKRARLAGAATPGQLVDLNDALNGLSTVLQAVYRDKRLRIDIAVPAGLQVAADREDMMELFGNLMDNAAKWATTTVRVSATQDADGGVTVTVDDDGPGCPPEQIAGLTSRGTRADESAPGHGLGLAIADEVVGSYGGELILGDNTALGGFRAQVILPRKWAADS